jgi:hypothetical protein
LEIIFTRLETEKNFSSLPVYLRLFIPLKENTFCRMCLQRKVFPPLSFLLSENDLSSGNLLSVTEGREKVAQGRGSLESLVNQGKLFGID